MEDRGLLVKLPGLALNFEAHSVEEAREGSIYLYAEGLELELLPIAEPGRRNNWGAHTTIQDI